MTFPDRFWRYPQITNVKKPRPVGAEFFHSDGQRARLKPTRHIFCKHFCTIHPLLDLFYNRHTNIRGCDDAVSTDIRTCRRFGRIVLSFLGSCSLNVLECLTLNMKAFLSLWRMETPYRKRLNPESSDLQPVILFTRSLIHVSISFLYLVIIVALFFDK